ncbi:telomere repeats-binding bouquet formation protein 1 isoform X2 [Hoplias malabaricus]|uniref:telomere repeats-binding bouquet formation protein 1 isoform X2 n=2 Tax=Hoplias malabaricus TaxID=27720 RepID=UPI003462C8B5
MHSGVIEEGNKYSSCSKMLHVKTDLQLLLECLKYQMECPDSQKQALLTIVSICQQNEQNVEFLKEIGGVTFINNLSRWTNNSEVKETALFTLGSLAEFNENCKQDLCREETFCDLAASMKNKVPHKQKRVAVYMLCVLVSNNKRGQTLAKGSGCIDILLTLFRDSFPVSGGPNELLLLWTAVSSALCGCVNNPQNEENQQMCTCVFPLVKVWLLQVSVHKPELAQPICSFISMTVANNRCAQQYFASVGGLLILTKTLANVALQGKENAVACKLAALITRTMSACIADNEALAPVISELQMVPDLLLLLSNPSLSPQDQLAVLLTLGHCTDACVEHQSQLLLGGGLPMLISLLTEASNEEVRKAAIFVLQTCKKIMVSLSGDVLSQNAQNDLQRHWQSACEMLQRIQHLEKQQQMWENQWEKETENSPDRHTQPVLLRPVECSEELWEDLVVQKVKGQSRVYEEELDRENILHNYMIPTGCQAQPITNQCMQNLKPVHDWRQIYNDIEKSLNPFKMRGESKELVKNEKRELQMRREDGIKKDVEKTEVDERGGTMIDLSRSTDRVKCTKRNPETATCIKPPAEGDRGVQSPDIFRHPAPMKQHQQRQTLSKDEFSLCSELLENEIKRIIITPVVSKPNKLRCAGCLSGVDEVDSRTVGAVLHSCKYLCEFHVVLQQAEDHFRRALRHENALHVGRARDAGLFKSISKHAGMENKERLGYTKRQKNWDAMKFINLTPLKRPCEVQGFNTEKTTISGVHKTILSNFKETSVDRHRKRKNYSADELLFLNEGARRFGNSWNSILWAYPFQHGRTNSELARKYRKLKQGLAQAPDLLTLDCAEQRVR